MSDSEKIELKEKVAHLPRNPGVYLFKDKNDKILYVGKAKRLRNRVRSYFQDVRNLAGRTQVMVSKIEDLDVIVTDSEAEALILESTLIKKHHPRYNVMYRDDKSYPYICITNEERSRIFPTRTVIKDGSTYYGPYDHVGHMRRMLDAIRESFNLCTCACSSRTVDKTRGVPKWHSCFDDYLENCSGDWPLDLYEDAIEKARRMLNGKTEELVRDLKEEMEIASEALDFEKAAKLRDAIQAVKRYSRKMKMVADKKVNRDLFALYIDEEITMACGVLFKIREGKLIGKFHRFIKNIQGLAKGDILQSFVEDYFTGSGSFGAGIIPDEVYVSHALPDDEPLLQYLWEQRGKKVPIHHPKIGEKKQLVRMAISNAKLLLGEKKLAMQKARRERIPHAVKQLKKDLRLERLPRRIECFDNSNLQGTDPVASMVCFVDAKPRKSEYKRFHIKTVKKPDDYASMKEVVARRYKRVIEEGQHIADLIIVDGGKGQLSSAVEALKEIDFYGEVPVVALAKRLEEVFIPGKKDPVMIPKTSSSLKLIQKLRDEAHRFAISFHRNKRSKRTIKSELREIKGIGPETVKKLLKYYGSVKQVKKSDEEELSSLVGKHKAKLLRSNFQD